MDCLSLFLSINFAAVVVCAVVCFMLGSVWFSGIFGQAWVEELGRHNVVIKAPTKGELATKMGLTFFMNLICAAALAVLLAMVGVTSVSEGVCVGVLAALGFAATTVASIFSWESRSLNLFLIDIGYYVVCIITSSIILSLWR